MIKKCPKCYRELDTDKDFCVLCGENYRNEELDKKIVKTEKKEDKIQEEKEEEKEESSIIPVIIYGLGALILGPLVISMNFLASLFSGIDGNKIDKPFIWIVLEVIVGICFIGAIVSLASRNSNKK